MNFNKILGKIYKVKIKGDKKITRILFFKFIKKTTDKEKNEYYRKHPLKVFKPNISNIGRCTYTGSDIIINNPESTTIGSFCSIARRCILGHGNHPTNFLTTSPYLYDNQMGYKEHNFITHENFDKAEGVKIGNDVWIGDGVFVKNGIKIADGAIVGARSVVTKDIPPYAIAIGVPAKVIKYRFNEYIIKDLLELKWWDLPDEIIKTLPYDNIEETIKILKEIRENK